MIRWWTRIASPRRRPGRSRSATTTCGARPPLGAAESLNPGETLDGYLLESALILRKTYTLFLRAERVAETELHHDEPALHGRVLSVNKISVGGIWDFYRRDHVTAGIGALVSKYVLPDELKPLYGSDPTSGMVFARIKVQ